ncbi:MAG: hypothetical protein KF696_07930 [Planctomycetes bacterium]|nr:hypothetical protein [Planctomycetota bacterium]MCW8135721.1 hypothetical protein [Planctomycetota bacterium]
MNAILARIDRRLAVAPFLGLLAGFLINRARGGEMGLALLYEMIFGALIVGVGGVLLQQAARLRAEREAEAARQFNALAAQASARRLALVEAETARYRTERMLHEQALQANLRAEHLAIELDQQRSQTGALQQALSALASRVGTSDQSAELQKATRRIEKLEAESLAARQARERLAALEAAQDALRRESVEVGMRAMQEAEEVKASLLQLSITESQRRRNIAAPENDQSGRLIELEARIKRLAFEIERLSSRNVATVDDGEASLVKAGGTQDQARIGFLRAMLDANKVLRQQIRSAA